MDVSPDCDCVNCWIGRRIRDLERENAALRKEANETAQRNADLRAQLDAIGDGKARFAVPFDSGIAYFSVKELVKAVRERDALREEVRRLQDCVAEFERAAAPDRSLLKPGWTWIGIDLAKPDGSFSLVTVKSRMTLDNPAPRRLVYATADGWMTTVESPRTVALEW